MSIEVLPLPSTREQVVVSVARMTLSAIRPVGDGPYSWRMEHRDGARILRLFNGTGEQVSFMSGLVAA